MLSGICVGMLRLPHGIAGRSLLGYTTTRYRTAPATGADSLKARFSPVAVTGDVFITGMSTTPGNYRLQLREDGTWWYEAHGDTSAQVLRADLFTVATQALAGEGTLAINSAAPKVVNASGQLFDGATFQIGQPVSLTLKAVDPQGGSVTFAIQSGSYPPGMTLSSAGLVGGTPTTYGSYGFHIRISNAAGSYTDTTETVTIAGFMPKFVGEQLSAAQATIAAIGISEAHTSITSSAPVGQVLTQDIPENTPITSAVTINLQVSNGAGTGPTGAASVFPSDIAGLTYDGTRTVNWSTSIQEAANGKVSALTYMQYPIIEWDLNYEVLNQAQAVDDLKKLLGLYANKQGAATTFLFTDPVFNTVTDEVFGTGDGTTKAFQLVAHYGVAGGPSAAEIIQQLQAPPTIKNNGTVVSTSAYTVSSTGLITFTTAPASGNPLTWTGSFNYLVRFEDDKLTPQQFLAKFWSLQSLKLVSVIV